MIIKEGGTTINLKGNIKTLIIAKQDNASRKFELWINGDSLSYLTIDEMMDLKHEINEALRIYIG